MHFYLQSDPKAFLNFRPQVFGPYAQLHLPVNMSITPPASWAVYSFPPLTMEEVNSLVTMTHLSISPLELILSPFHRYCDLYSFMYFHFVSFISIIILFLSTSAFKHVLVLPLKREMKKNPKSPHFHASYFHTTILPFPAHKRPVDSVCLHYIHRFIYSTNVYWYLIGVSHCDKRKD